MRHQPNLSIELGSNSERLIPPPDSTASDVPLTLSPRTANTSQSPLSSSTLPNTPAASLADHTNIPSPSSSRHVTPADYNRLFNSPTSPTATQSVSPRGFVGVRQERSGVSSHNNCTEHYGYYTLQPEALPRRPSTRGERLLWRYCCCLPSRSGQLVKHTGVMCFITGSSLAILLTVYLALATSHQITSDAFTIVFLILIVVITIIFIYLLIRLCLAAYPLDGTLFNPDSQACSELHQSQPHSSPFLYSFSFAAPRSSQDTSPGQSHQHRLAYPIRPIRVILARDEELAHGDDDENRRNLNDIHADEDGEMVIGRYGNVEKRAIIRPPPPAYGLWRNSVRVDPNLLYWQRNDHATAGCTCPNDTSCACIHSPASVSSSSSPSSSSSSPSSSSSSPSPSPSSVQLHRTSRTSHSSAVPLPPSPAYFDVCSPPPPPSMPPMASTVAHASASQTSQTSQAPQTFPASHASEEHRSQPTSHLQSPSTRHPVGPNTTTSSAPTCPEPNTPALPVSLASTLVSSSSEPPLVACTGTGTGTGINAAAAAVAAATSNSTSTSTSTSTSSHAATASIDTASTGTSTATPTLQTQTQPRLQSHLPPRLTLIVPPMPPAYHHIYE